MEVDPWAVVVRYGRWYLLCWSHTADARRVLRVDRVDGDRGARRRRSTPPEELDPVDALEQHLSEGWRYEVEVVVDAPIDDARATGASQRRPARADRREPHPPGRYHRRALVVRRAPRRAPRTVPRGPPAGAARRRTTPRRAADGGRQRLSLSPQATAQGSSCLCSPRRVAAHPMHRFARVAGDFRVRVVRRRSARSSVARELGHKSSSRQSEVRKMSGGGMFSGLSGRSGSSAQEMPPLTRPPAPATSPGDHDRVSDPIPFDRTTVDEPDDRPNGPGQRHDAHQRHRPRADRGRDRPHRPADARTSPSPGRSSTTATRG